MYKIELTIVAMLYIRSLELTYLITENLCPLANILKANNGRKEMRFFNVYYFSETVFGSLYLYTY